MPEKTYKVKLYRNLTRDCWSVKTSYENVRLADALTLFDVGFQVGENARQKVIATKHKNVHAFVTVDMTKAALERSLAKDNSREDLTGWDRVSYNPYMQDFFYKVENGQEVTGARAAHLSEKGELFVLLPKLGTRAAAV